MSGGRQSGAGSGARVAPAVLFFLRSLILLAVLQWSVAAPAMPDLHPPAGALDVAGTALPGPTPRDATLSSPAPVSPAVAEKRVVAIGGSPKECAGPVEFGLVPAISASLGRPTGETPAAGPPRSIPAEGGCVRARSPPAAA